MRSNRSIRLGIALIAGACALLVLFILWRALRPAPQVAQNTAPVNGVTPVSMQTGRQSAVALMDIPERSIIVPGMFRMEELPEDAVASVYVTDPPSQSFGFITRKRILKNDRLRTSDLVGHISEVGIAGALKPGTTAISLPLTTKPTFHDIVRIGDFVDVIASFDGQESRTIIENVRVLAVDVFGRDYPQTTSIAQRGDYKAPAHSVRADVPPPSPPPAPPSSEAEAQNRSTPAPGAAPAPAATPTPTPTPPPARPVPAITLEVTPDQANRINLAQNSSAALDFLIRPLATGTIVHGLPGVEARLAAVTRAQLAPYAESKKTTTTKSGNAGGGGQSGRSNRARLTTVSDTGFSGPVMPPPAPTGLKPAEFGEAAPDSYGIPIYADGTRKRIDVVRKPAE
jgi:Flp pilus assembly protein CpaB